MSFYVLKEWTVTRTGSLLPYIPHAKCLAMSVSYIKEFRQNFNLSRIPASFSSPSFLVLLSLSSSHFPPLSFDFGDRLSLCNPRLIHTLCPPRTASLVLQFRNIPPLWSEEVFSPIGFIISKAKGLLLNGQIYQTTCQTTAMGRGISVETADFIWKGKRRKLRAWCQKSTVTRTPLLL